MKGKAAIYRWLPAAVAAYLMLNSTLVLAQQYSCPTDERKPRQTAMDERTYRRLSVVHELLGNSALPEAMQKLKVLAAKGGFTPYEEAQIEQTYGFILAQMGGEENYRRAYPHFERAIALDALPDSAQKGMMYSLASLYASMGRYQDTIDMMMKWRCLEKEPPGSALVLISSSYAQLEKLREALPWVQEAISSQPEKPVESWYQLELAIFYELSQYQNAANALRIVLTHWPDKARYWEMLAGAYQELRQDGNALAAMMLAYHKGLLVKESRLVNLVRMNLFLENPYAGGSILDTEINRGRVQATQKNLELLLNAWTAAREFDKAISVIDRLGPMSDDGEFYYQKAQLFMEKADWREVVTAADMAVEKGGLKNVCSAFLMKGVANAELDHYAAADAALDRAGRSSCKRNTRQQATGWKSYVADRRDAARARSGQTSAP
ncbi:MAG: tetratricopeptide repeat protein [Gammaproteobacteria bacterium]|nr:tetratricopeptide repeat protein [Gammaproteobacteria bacterium]